jgi:hypothetical protein
MLLPISLPVCDADCDIVFGWMQVGGDSFVGHYLPWTGFDLVEHSGMARGTR